MIIIQYVVMFFVKQDTRPPCFIFLTKRNAVDDGVLKYKKNGGKIP